MTTLSSFAGSPIALSAVQALDYTRGVTTDAEKPRSWAADILTGVYLTLPMVIVFSAVGMTFSVLATQAGLPIWGTLLMSFLVFAGAAQLAALQLMILGISPLSIILTTAVINSRFLPMSTSIAPRLRQLRLFERIAYATQMTDASFAIHTVRLINAPPRRLEMFTTHIVSHAAWMAGSVVGVVVGRSAIDFERVGVDFAIPAMFLALLLPMVRKRAELAVAVLAGGSAVGFNLAGFGNWTTLTATVLTVAVVRIGETWIKARSS